MLAKLQIFLKGQHSRILAKRAKNIVLYTGITKKILRFYVEIETFSYTGG